MRHISKAVSVLLTLALVLTLAPVTGVPARANSEHTHNGITFTAWTSSDSLPTSAGSYYLTTDVTLGSMWACTANINLCLNGHGIIYTNSNDYANPCAITVQNNATLSLYDCGTAAEHKYTVDSNGLATVNDESGTETFTGGYVTGSGRQRGVCVRGGTFHLYGGTILGCAVSNSNDGAGVYVGSFSTQSAVNAFNMYGGCIRNNYGKYGGGVYVDYGVFTLSGGRIESNRAEENGGGVYVSSTGAFEMIGGAITGNAAKHGGGAYAYGYESGGVRHEAVIKMSGSPVIDGNTASDGSSGNVCLLNGVRVQVENKLTRETSVGVTTAKEESSPDVWEIVDGVLTQGKPEGAEKILFSDDDRYIVATVPEGEDAGEAALYRARTVTFNANYDEGDPPATPTQKVPEGVKVPLTANAFTRKEFNFTGWNTLAAPTESEPGTAYADKAGVTLTEDTTLYAQWAPRKYTVTFDANGGKGTMDPVEMISGDYVLPANGFTPPAGKRFRTWGIGEGKYRPGDVYEVTADTVVLALWETAPAPDSYTPPTFRPAVAEAEHGTVRVSPSAPAQGEKVTVTPVPDRWYQVDAVAVTDRLGRAVEVTKNADGAWTFRQPAGNVTVAATFKLMEPVARYEDYPDLDPDAWYADVIRWVLARGLMVGTGKGFAPERAASVAEIVQLLFNLDGAEAGESANVWYAPAMTWAAEIGILPAGDTDPESPAAREQAAVLFYNYAGYKGLDVSAQDDLTRFSDAAEVSEAAVPALRWAVAVGLMNGTGHGKLSPRGTTLRAEMAALLARFCGKTGL